MELSWNEKGELSYGVHLKPNQQLKYLDKGSSHTKACLKAITNGVYSKTRAHCVYETLVAHHGGHSAL
jgi:hypothetical protein